MIKESARLRAAYEASMVDYRARLGEREREMLERKEASVKQAQIDAEERSKKRLSAFDGDQTKASRYGFSSNLLSGMPAWCERFAGIVLSFVEKEEHHIEQMLLASDSNGSVSSAKDEAEGIRLQRVHNLVITINRIRKCLELQLSHGENYDSFKIVCCLFCRT